MKKTQYYFWLLWQVYAVHSPLGPPLRTSCRTPVLRRIRPILIGLKPPQTSGRHYAHPGLAAPAVGPPGRERVLFGPGSEAQQRMRLARFRRLSLSPPALPSSNFILWIGVADPGSDAADLFNAEIDNTTLFTTNATEIALYPSYTLVSIDVSVVR